MPNTGQELVFRALKSEVPIVVMGRTQKQCVKGILELSPDLFRLTDIQKRLISREIDACLKELIRDDKLFWRRARKGRLKVGLVLPDEAHIARKLRRNERSRGYTPRGGPIRSAAQHQRKQLATG